MYIVLLVRIPNLWCRPSRPSKQEPEKKRVSHNSMMVLLKRCGGRVGRRKHRKKDTVFFMKMCENTMKRVGFPVASVPTASPEFELILVRVHTWISYEYVIQ